MAENTVNVGDTVTRTGDKSRTGRVETVSASGIFAEVRWGKSGRTTCIRAATLKKVG